MSDRGDVVDWLLNVGWPDVPNHVRTRLFTLLRDFAAVCAAGRATETARIAADDAASEHPGDAATALLDGRRLSATGAAWANGVLANALDFDDGHRLVKGHPGANVIPAALAVAESVAAPLEEFLAAVAVGYEVAIRAGIRLHAQSAEYHASGAWGALGAAAASARLLGLDSVRARHALGLAEYHAPIAPVMRSVRDPAMTKDACGLGAYLGVSSALLAGRGFTATASAFLEDADASADLGERWHLLDVYVKKFPCCRWSHPAIEAALDLHRRFSIDPRRIARVRVDTFSAAAALAGRHPTTTEEAQYSLVWPVAAALAHGRFDVEQVLPAAFGDPASARLLPLVDIAVDPSFDDAFPERRLARVAIELEEHAAYRSDVTEAPGEPSDPRWADIVEGKLARWGAEIPRAEPIANVGDAQTADQLVSLLAGAAATRAPKPTPIRHGV